MIKFRCENCQKKIGVPDEYAGKQVRCPQCKDTLRVPEPELQLAAAEEPAPIWSDELLQGVGQEEQSPPMQLAPAEPAAPVKPKMPRFDERICPRCSQGNVRDTDFCVHCGCPLKKIAREEPHSSSLFELLGDAGAYPIIILGGLIGAGIGAVIWVFFTKYVGFRSGYIAFLVGVLSAVGMRVAARDNSRDFGLLAVLIAIVGMAGGKLLSVQWITIPAQKEMSINLLSGFGKKLADNGLLDDNTVFGMVLEEKVRKKEITEENYHLIISYHDREVEEVPEDVKAMHDQIADQVDSMSIAEKKRYIENSTKEIVEAQPDPTYQEKFKIAFRTWYFDLFGVFFAALGAWKIGSGW